MKRTHAEDEGGNSAKRFNMNELRSSKLSPSAQAILNYDFRQSYFEPIQYTLSFDLQCKEFSLRPEHYDLNVTHMLNVAKMFPNPKLNLTDYGLGAEIDFEAAAADSKLIYSKVIESQIERGVKNIVCDFSNQKLSVEDLKTILNLLKTSDEALFILNLNNCEINDSHMDLLDAFLREEDSILELHLDNNSIKNKGFKKLVKNIQHVYNLEALTLSNNEIGGKALTEKIIGKFALNTSLKCVDLQANLVITEAEQAYKELQDIIDSDPYESSPEGESDEDIALDASTPLPLDGTTDSPTDDLGVSGATEYIE